MVLTCSVRIPRVPTYSGIPYASLQFHLRDFYPLRFTFPGIFGYCYSCDVGLLYPTHITICGLGWSDFARHYFRNRFYFLFLRVIRCFSSPGSPYYAMYLRNNTITLLMVSFLIRISTDLCLFATPRSFSQLVTSFFGAMYQGILLYALCSLIFFS